MKNNATSWQCGDLCLIVIAYFSNMILYDCLIFVTQRREWLENALTSMTVSPVEEMKKGIEVIQDPTKDVDDKIQALESIQEWCDHIDFAVGRWLPTLDLFYDWSPVVVVCVMMALDDT